MLNDSSIPFGRNLTAIMKHRGMKIEDVSRLCGVGKSVVHSWMNGSSPRDLRAVKRFSDAVGISFSELVFGEKEKIKEASAPLNESVTFFDGLCRLRIERVFLPGENSLTRESPTKAQIQSEE